MAIGDIYKVYVKGNYDDNLIVCTGHIKFKTVGATPDLAAAVLQAVVLDGLSSMTSDCHWTERGWSKLSVPPVVGSTSITQNGGAAAGSGVPNQIACVYSLKTGYAGRSYRGRIYIPGWTESVTTNGSFTSAIVTSLQTALTSRVTQFGAGGTDPDYEWGIFSRKLGETRVGGVLTGYDLTKFWPITSAIVRPICGTQRRRRVGVGA